MKLADLITDTIDKESNEASGFKKYPRAKYTFTKERAKEFQNTSIEYLIDDPYFLNLKNDLSRKIWDKNKEVLLKLFEEKKKRLIKLFVYTGPIGVGKSLFSSELQFIQFFYLITLPNISLYYNRPKGQSIAFISLSKDALAAKKVTFKKLLPVFNECPFIRDYFPPQIDLDKIGDNPSRFPSELRFPKDIVIFPGTGQSASVLGYDVYAGTMDEVNDMQIVEGSKKEVLKHYYSAAESSEREIIQRIDSRFPFNDLFRQEKHYGFLTCIGQARYPDSFTERKIREAEVLGDKSTTFYFNAPRWLIQPRTRFSREEFIYDLLNQKEIIWIKSDFSKEEMFCFSCNTSLIKGAYVGNKGKLVCSLDCYAKSYGMELEYYKEKMSPC